MKRSGGSSSRWLIAAFLAVLGTTATALAAEDFTVRMQNDEGKPATRYVSQKAVRQVSSYPVETDVIYRLDQGKIIRLDHKAKTYTETTPAAASQAFSGQSPGGGKLPAGLSSSTVTRVGGGQPILGHATDEYAVKSFMGQSRVWVTTALAYPSGYAELVAASLPPPAKAMFLGNRVQGFALKTVTTLTAASGASTSEIATAIEKGPIPVSTFEPPAGYKKVQPQ
jgi:uncharacterized protein DUF4412